MSWDSVLVWIEHHPGLASWVQAVGPILAIAAAGWFPFAHEQAKESRHRKNVIRSLLYLSITLRDLQLRILKAFSNEGLHARWLNGDGLKELQLTSQLISEIPANMLVGFEMTYLADLRLGAQFAQEMHGYLVLARSGPIDGICDIKELLNNNKSKLDQLERLIKALNYEPISLR